MSFGSDAPILDAGGIRNPPMAVDGCCGQHGAGGCSPRARPNGASIRSCGYRPALSGGCHPPDELATRTRLHRDLCRQIMGMLRHGRLIDLPRQPDQRGHGPRWPVRRGTRRPCNSCTCSSTRSVRRPASGSGPRPPDSRLRARRLRTRAPARAYGWTSGGTPPASALSSPGHAASTGRGGPARKRSSWRPAPGPASPVPTGRTAKRRMSRQRRRRHRSRGSRSSRSSRIRCC
jgi:hypothetical protein